MLHGSKLAPDKRDNSRNSPRRLGRSKNGIQRRQKSLREIGNGSQSRRREMERRGCEKRSRGHSRVQGCQLGGVSQGKESEWILLHSAQAETRPLFCHVHPHYGSRRRVLLSLGSPPPELGLALGW